LGQAFDAMANAIYSHEISLNAEIKRSHALREQQAIMLHELNHRVKNTLATVQSLVRQARGGEEQTAELEGRILALSKTHDLLTHADWTSAPLREVVNNELAPYQRRTGSIAIDGPEVELPARHVLALGMTLHELTTNAAKYGALSSEEGCISLTWSISHTDGCTLQLSLTWREHDGPAVVQPSRRGFGTRLIMSSIERELAGRVKLDFGAAGFVCQIEVPLEQQKASTGCPPEAIGSLAL
jgi:two-component sensor histidine kinase